MHIQSKFRLLVVRLGAMGDILHALPAVTALRQTHPGWIIDWVVEPRWRALLSADAGQTGAAGQIEAKLSPRQPVVNQLHFAATRDWRKAPFAGTTFREIRSLRSAIKTNAYDVVLDLQGALRSAIVGRFAACRRVIGEAHPREGIARLFFTELVETEGTHVIEQDVELAAAIAGDDLSAVPPLLPVDPVAEEWADSILPPAVPHSSQLYRDEWATTNARTVLINPGAGWGAKRWPAERYAAVAQTLAARGMRVLVNIGPGEEPLAATILQSAPTATPLHCTLEQLIALTRRVSLAIAGDTGPLHLACALGRPVVGIYGPTDPSRNGPFGSRFKVLRSPESRRDHTRHAAPEAGLLTITPGDVLQAADELLAVEATP